MSRTVKEVSVQLARSELVYDLKFVTNRIAKIEARDDEGKQLKIASAMSAEGKENADYINRQIENAITELRSRTAWADAGKRSRMVTNELPLEQWCWILVFKVPVDWRGDAKVLGGLIHEYVSNYITAKWLSMTAPSHKADYEEEANTKIEDIRYELMKAPPSKPQYTQI